MEIRIEWSELSERQLKDIFDHYSLQVNERLARKIINRIIDRVSVLESNPLVDRKKSFYEITRKISDTLSRAITKSYTGKMKTLLPSHLSLIADRTQKK